MEAEPKVITVANSSHARVFSNAVTVTGPGTVSPSLTGRPGVPAATPAPPIGSTISGPLVVAPGGTGGNAGDACAPFPAGTFTGKIPLVARGTCAFAVKEDNVAAAGATSWIVHNNGPDAPIAMGGLTAPAIPGVMVTLANGRALVSWATANPTATVDIEGPLKRLTSGWPDAGRAVRAGERHVDGVAAHHRPRRAAKAKHPDFTPAQVKSALLNTAQTSMSLDLEGTIPALAKHRGAGRVNAARLANPQLTFAPASVSFGLMQPTETKQLTIVATDVRESGPNAGYAVNVRQVVGNPAVTVSPTLTFTSAPAGSATVNVSLATAGAPVGDYEGFVEVTGLGQTYTIPYFVRILNPGAAKDVLLIDWDRNVGADFRPAYGAALTALNVSYDVFDGGVSTNANGNPGPTFAQLQNYRAVVMFTGSNTASWAVTHVGGSFPLQDYLVVGGKLVMTGQDPNSQLVYNQNVGSDFLFGTMPGWMTGAERNPATCAITRSDRDFYGSGMTAPTPTAQLETAFTLFGRSGDVSVNLGGTGAGNQRFPDAGRTVAATDDTDTCLLVHNADTASPHARVLGSYTTTKLNGTAVSRLTNSVATGVAPDPTLEQLDPTVSWGAALLHVGAEGLNPNRGALNLQSALDLLHDFVADSVSVAITHKVHGKRVDFAVSAVSARGSAITKYRWDFGDGSPIVETTAPRVTYTYGKGARGTYTVNVQAVTELTRSGVGSTSVRITRN